MKDSEIENLAEEIIKAGTCDLMKASMSPYMALRKKNPKEFVKLCRGTLRAIVYRAEKQIEEYIKEQDLEKEV